MTLLISEWVKWHDLPTGGMCEFLDKSGKTMELEMLIKGGKIRWLLNAEGGKPLWFVHSAQA